MAAYENVSRHLFRRTARAHERQLSWLLGRGEWVRLERAGVEDPQTVSEFRVSPGRRQGYWRVQAR